MKKSLFVLCVLFLAVNSQAQRYFQKDFVILKNGSVIKGHFIDLQDGEDVRIKSLDGNIWCFSRNDIQDLGTNVVKNNDESYGKKNPNKVYLKNGSIITGSFSFDFDNERVKVFTQKGNVFVFQMNEIDSLVVAEHHVTKNYLNTGGFHVLIDAGFMGEASSNQQPSGYYDYQDNDMEAIVSFNWINQYELTPYLIPGLGVGVEWFGTPVLPVFLDLRVPLMQKTFRPVIFINGGYALPLDGKPESSYEIDYHGGLFGTAGVGFEKQYSSGSSVFLSFGFRYFAMRSSYLENDWRVDEERPVEVLHEFNRLSIRFGFRF